MTHSGGRHRFHFAIQLGLASGDTRAVEYAQRAACEALEEIGEKTNYSSVAALLARTLCDQGRYAEAAHYTRVSKEAARPNDVLSHIFWRSTQARVLAHRGEPEAAERLAREAVAFAEESDFLNSHGDALVDLAKILELGSRPEEAGHSLQEAIRLYELKGNTVSARKARALLRHVSKGAAQGS